MYGKKGKRLAICGVILQFGFVIGVVGTVIGMICAFAELTQGGETNIEALAAHISLALYAKVVGLLVSLVGVILLFVALFGKKYRASWFKTAMWIIAILWMFSIPIGTILGIVVIVYLSKHKEEFTEPEDRQLSCESVPSAFTDEVSS